MKNKILLTFFVFVGISFGKAAAQSLPETGSEENPAWYYIQVKGSDGREDFVFTAEGTEVHGRALFDTDNAVELKKQLWRFEDAGNGWFYIVNKGGKKVEVGYDTSRSIGYAKLVDNTDVKFKFVTNTGTPDLWTIQSSVPAPGGSASEIYLHQANTGGSRDYIIMLVGTDYGFGVNSAFRFILFNDYTVEYSTEQNTVWYNLVSGKTGTTNLAMQDNTGIASADHILSAETASNVATQQWKFTQNASGTVSVTNRATNNVIPANSLFSDPYNLIYPTAAAANAGHSLTYIGGGQYTLSAVEEDGIRRYLSLSEQREDPAVFDEENLIGSSFAWTLVKVNDTSVNIQVPSCNNQPVVTVKDGVISVENATDYRIFSVDGKSIGKGTKLVPGIYLVTANGATTKVLVKQ